MKLEFDSIHELEQFFMFSAHIGQAFAAQGQGAQVQPPMQVPAEMDKATVSDNGASAAPSALSGGAPAGEDAGADTDDVIADDAPATTAKRKRRTKAEIAADEAAAGEAMRRPLEEPTPSPVEMSGIDHLLACQSFIQAHGMQKYNESFRDGLNANIATYTAEQRVQHVAVLHLLAE